MICRQAVRGAGQDEPANQSRPSPGARKLIEISCVN